MTNPINTHNIHARCINMLGEIMTGLNSRLEVEHYEGVPKGGKFVRVEILIHMNEDGTVQKADRMAHMGDYLPDVLTADGFREVIQNGLMARIASQMAALQTELQFQGGDDDEEN